MYPLTEGVLSSGQLNRSDVRLAQIRNPERGLGGSPTTQRSSRKERTAICERQSIMCIGIAASKKRENEPMRIHRGRADEDRNQIDAIGGSRTEREPLFQLFNRRWSYRFCFALCDHQILLAFALLKTSDARLSSCMRLTQHWWANEAAGGGRGEGRGKGEGGGYTTRTQADHRQLRGLRNELKNGRTERWAEGWKNDGMEG